MAGSTDTRAASARINLNDANQLATWAKKLDTTSEQIREAVQSVGDKPADVELYLKGSRSTTNSERVAEKAKPH